MAGRVKGNAGRFQEIVKALMGLLLFIRCEEIGVERKSRVFDDGSCQKIGQVLLVVFAGRWGAAGKGSNWEETHCKVTAVNTCAGSNRRTVQWC